MKTEVKSPKTEKTEQKSNESVDDNMEVDVKEEKQEEKIEEKPKDKPTINPFFLNKKEIKVQQAGAGEKGSSYNPGKSNYHPIDDAFWKHGEK